MAAGCSKFNLNFFDRKTRYYYSQIDQLNNKQKLLGMHIFLKIVSIAKKKSSEWLVPRSCFREAEQLAVYQLLRNLAT